MAAIPVPAANSTSVTIHPTIVLTTVINDVRTTAFAVLYTSYGANNLPVVTTSIIPATNTPLLVTSSSSSSAQAENTKNSASGPHSPQPSDSGTSKTGIRKASSGITTGTAAGIGIGCAIAGLLIGFILAFILIRRRKRTHQQTTGSITNVAVEPKKTPSPDAESQDAIQLDHFLLAASPEGDIVSEFQSLDKLIQQHVESHYHLGMVNSSAPALSQILVHIGFTENGSSLSLDSIATLCLDYRFRHLGLRHVISQILFRSIDFDSRSSFSVLPSSVAAFIQSVPPSQNGGQVSVASSLALSKWRALSAFILHPDRAQRTALPATEDTKTAAINLANNLNSFLQFFVAQGPESRHEQASHLQAVIMEFTKFGYVIFSQPGDWRMEFEDVQEIMNSGSLVVCPGLEKLGRSDGTPYNVPRRIVAPDVVRLA